MLNLVKRKLVKAAHLKEPGKRRGSWLIWLPALLDYLHKEADRTADQLSSTEIASIPRDLHPY